MTKTWVWYHLFLNEDNTACTFQLVFLTVQPVVTQKWTVTLWMFLSLLRRPNQIHPRVQCVRVHSLTEDDEDDDEEEQHEEPRDKTINCKFVFPWLCMKYFLWSLIKMMITKWWLYSFFNISIWISRTETIKFSQMSSLNQLNHVSTYAKY